MISIKDVIDATFGTTKDDQYKTLVCTSIDQISQNNDDHDKEKIISTCTIETAVVDLNTTHDLAIIDLCFPRYSDLAYNRFLREIKYLFEKQEECSDFDYDMTLELHPIAMKGKCYWLCVSPIIWIGQNIIRLVFQKDNIAVMESNILDIDDMKNKAKRDAVFFESKENQQNVEVSKKSSNQVEQYMNTRSKENKWTIANKEENQ